MRFVLTLLFVVAGVVSAGAQGGSAPVKPAQPSAQQSEEILRQRYLLRERFNKGWDIQAEDPRQRQARCKHEARKRYSALHPLKRRTFIKNCVRQARG